MTSVATSPAVVRCDRTAAWAALAGHYLAHGRGFDVRVAFARDPGRYEAMSVEAPEIFADLPKNLVDVATLRFLADLARECGIEAQRDAMLAGFDQWGVELGKGLGNELLARLEAPAPAAATLDASPTGLLARIVR